MPITAGASSQPDPSASQVAHNKNLAAQACKVHGLNDLFKTICAEALSMDLEDPVDALEYAAKRIRDDAAKGKKK